MHGGPGNNLFYGEEGRERVLLAFILSRRSLLRYDEFQGFIHIYGIYSGKEKELGRTFFIHVRLFFVLKLSLFLSFIFNDDP